MIDKEAIKSELILLNRRVERLTEEISKDMPEMVINMELKLCIEALMNIKKEYEEGNSYE